MIFYFKFFVNIFPLVAMWVKFEEHGEISETNNRLKRKVTTKQEKVGLYKLHSNL